MKERKERKKCFFLFIRKKLSPDLRTGLVSVLLFSGRRRDLVRCEVDDRDLVRIGLQLPQDVVQLLHQNSAMLLRQKIFFHLVPKKDKLVKYL